MSKQITIQGFACCQPAESWEHGQATVIDGFTYRFTTLDSRGIDGYIYAGTATVTIDTPEGFDPRMGAVQALNEQKQKIMAEFQARMNEIDKQISQFTAIEFVEAA